MNRRKLLSGMVSLVGAGALAIGSGAFSNSTAQREITANVVNDRRGVLLLDPYGGSQRSSGGFRETGTIEFQFPGDDEKDEKVNVDAMIQYERDVDPAGADGLFRIGNHGTETVEVTDELVDPNSADKPDIGIFWVESDHNEEGLKPLLRDDPVKLEPGDELDAGIQVDTHGLDAEESKRYETKVTIKAESVDS